MFTGEVTKTRCGRVFVVEQFCLFVRRTGDKSMGRNLLSDPGPDYDMVDKPRLVSLNIFLLYNF